MAPNPDKRKCVNAGFKATSFATAAIKQQPQIDFELSQLGVVRNMEQFNWF
jgi:hypothetical protein